MEPLVARAPVAGGLDVDLPGDRVRLRATRWPGAGVPVVLLHGLASTRRFWDLVVPGVTGLPVLALDQRGHGDSDRPEGPYDAGTAARDALTALDALGLSRAVVVGHSWGAWVALRMAADAPERVLAAVGVDGGFAVPRRPAESREQARRRLTPPPLALPPQDLPARLRSGPLAPWWSDQVEQALLPVFGLGTDGLARARLPFEAHMAILDDLLDADGDAVLARVRCPTWLVACRPLDGTGPQEPDDADKAAALQRAGRLLDAPRLLTWRGAVHDVPLQWPDLVVGLIRAAAAEAAVGAGREGTSS